MRREFFEVKEIAMRYEREQEELPNSEDRYVFEVARRCFEAWSDVQYWLGRNKVAYISADENKAIFGRNLLRLMENRIMEIDI